jgi:LytS/YehU family sensor histidine kinase
MRQKVIDYELEQLKKIVTDEYDGTDNPKPDITLIIVNKRVRQRFFEKEGRYITNPPQGTFVDQGFVE